MSAMLRIDRPPHDLIPFSRDLLFISIYESCKHRPQAHLEAANLTQQIINRLQADSTTPGLVRRQQIVTTAHEVLGSFDGVAATFYAAYHPL